VNRVLATFLFTFCATPLVAGQCVIKPIKPIPTLGCKDVTPQCVSDNNGQSHWSWICVPDNGEADTSKARERHTPQPEPVTPGDANGNTVSIAPDDAGGAAPQQVLTSQAPIGAPTEAWAKSEIDQMRSIVQAIKQCKPDVVSINVNKRIKAKITETTGIPFNVTWDVAPSSSMRAPYSGYIEVVVGHHMDTDSTKIGDLEMQSDFNSRPAFIDRYEFDLTPDGLSFQRKLKRNENETKWVDDQERGWCWDRTVLSAVSAK
jgi:hypothetical protein